MFRRGLSTIGLVVLVGLVSCTTVPPSVVFSSLPATIVGGGTYTLTLTGSPGTSTGLWIYTLSSSCGGTFTLVSPTGIPTSGNLIIGPTDARTVTVRFTVPVPSADLSVTKSDSPDPVGVGYNLTYTLNIANTGSCIITTKLTTIAGRQSSSSSTAGVAAGNVVLIDTLPTPVTFVSATPSQGTCTGTSTVTCNLGTINSGASQQVQIVVNPQAGAVPSITNTVSVTGDITDTNPANNTASASTTVTPVADLAVTKSDSPDPVNATQNLTYTVTVMNGGPNPATNVQLTDTLPAAVTFVSATPSQGTCTGTSTVTCNLGTIANGGNATATIVVKPTGAAVPSISNSVNVTATEFDPNTANNSDTEGTTVNPAADLSVSKSDNPDPVLVGQNLTYTVTVTNGGPNPATNVQLTDTLPTAATFVSVTPGACSYNAGPHTVTCSWANIASAGSQVVTIVVTPTGAAVPSITNSVSVTGTEFDSTAGNNSDTEDTTVNPAADLSVSKSDSPDPVVYRQNVTYTITVSNAGPSNASNVTLTDPLPANAQFVSATPSQGTCTGTSTVTCNLGTINSGNNATVTIVVTAKLAAVDLMVDDTPANNGGLTCPESVTNPVSVAGSEFDPNPGNNSANATTNVTANHTTIQAAVNAASAGQKIFVCPGTYAENLNITKALTLTGTGVYFVTLNPTTTAYAIGVSGGGGNNVTIEGLTVNAGSSTNFMVHVSGVSNFVIQNVKVVGAGRMVQPGGVPLGGVDLIAVITATIKNVEVKDVSRNGVSLTNSTGVTLENLDIHDTGVSTGWAGVAVYATAGTTSATFAGSSTVTNTPMGLYVGDFAGTTVNLSLSSGVTFSGQSVAPIVRYGLGSVPGLEATGPSASIAEGLGLIARLTAPAFPTPPVNAGASFFYTVSDAINAAVASPPPYPLFTVVYHLTLDQFFVGNGMVIQRAVNAASSGDRINVEPGTYNETVTIAKVLTLNGAQAGVDARGRSTPNEAIVSSTNALGTILIGPVADTVDGFKLSGTPTPGSGGVVYVSGLTTNVIVKNTIVEPSTADGILFWNAQNGTTERNRVKGAARGGITGGKDNLMKSVLTIRNNLVESALYGISGYLDNSVISDNVITGTAAQVNGAGIGGQFFNTTITGNQVSGYTAGVGLAFQDYLSRGMANINVNNNSFSGNAAGVYVNHDITGLGITVNFNNIAGNSTGGVVYGALGAGTLNAENNWWGCAAGPGNPGCDTVSGNVDFTPWLTAPVP